MTTVDYGPDVAALRRRLAETEAERDRLRAELDALSERVCDECDGSGQYLIDDEVRVCVCVGETKPYLRLEDELTAARIAIARTKPAVCVVCSAPAACFGEYESLDGSGAGYACDVHCAHGNEDGWCETVVDDEDGGSR